MNGFFDSDEIKVFKKLPPRLQVELPKFTPKQIPKIENNPPKPQLIMDIECYPNYFLVKFLRLSDGKFLSYEKTKNQNLDIKPLLKLILDCEIITFNGNQFDIPLLKYAISGASLSELKDACEELISGKKPYKFEKRNDMIKCVIDHIDLIELCPGISSLKIYGGRLHCQKLQDLPFDPDKPLTKNQMDQVSDYCSNDLKLTKFIFLELLEQIELRRKLSDKYNMDMLSKSDAQIAENIIVSELSKSKSLRKREVESFTFKYKIPKFIDFTSDGLHRVLDILHDNEFTVDHSGRPKMPKELSDLKVKIGQSIYRMGIGGLHSSEKMAFHVQTDNVEIFDWDVTSYYPSIILNLGLFPKQLGVSFLELYQTIVTERIQAKVSGDKVKSDAFKIVVNGTYGKLGSPYSMIYAPEQMIQVTVTGQLSLLMLVEMLEIQGISVISGNTDGVTVKCPKDRKTRMEKTIKRWEQKTGFNMEMSQYAGIYFRDVNNYIAFKSNGGVKLKGCFRPPDLDKNPENEICTIAVIEYLKNGTPFKTTIRECKDITKFLTVRAVKGGAVYKGEYLGKAVRWYHSKKGGSINYHTNNNQVASGNNVVPVMDLDIEFPTDIDYDWYIRACEDIFGKER